MSSSEAPIAIKFDHVTKTYKLYENDKQRFLSVFRSNDKRKLVATVNACDDLSFEVKRGEAVAFLGTNGAGKSTTLKMITGVTYPTKGEVTVNGTVSALLELTAGFDMKLTGRENIYLRGHALGLEREEIAELEPKVVEVSADLGVYIRSAGAHLFVGHEVASRLRVRRFKRSGNPRSGRGAFGGGQAVPEKMLRPCARDHGERGRDGALRYAYVFCGRGVLHARHRARPWFEEV